MVFWEEGQPLHLLHIFAREAALALDQVAVREVAAEPEALRAWLEQLASKFPAFKVLTEDALMAQRDLCQAIVESYRDYLFRIKKPAPALCRCSPSV